MYLSESETTSQNKMSAKKKYFTINCIHLIYTNHVWFHLPLPLSVTVSTLTVSAFSFLTLSPNIPTLFTAIPQQIITAWIYSTS